MFAYRLFLGGILASCTGKKQRCNLYFWEWKVWIVALLASGISVQICTVLVLLFEHLNPLLCELQLAIPVLQRSTWEFQFVLRLLVLQILSTWKLIFGYKDMKILLHVKSEMLIILRGELEDEIETIGTNEPTYAGKKWNGTGE